MESIGTHWIAVYVNGDNGSFDSFEVEHIPKEVKKFIRKKDIINNIYRMLACDSVTCGYFCTEFIDFTLKGRTLLDFTNVFSPDECEKNDKIILKHFQ